MGIFTAARNIKIFSAYLPTFISGEGNLLSAFSNLEDLTIRVTSHNLTSLKWLYEVNGRLAISEPAVAVPFLRCLKVGVYFDQFCTEEEEVGNLERVASQVQKLREHREEF
jgi:hypothetical protein